MTIDELKDKKYLEQNRKCAYCGKLLLGARCSQLGHVLPQRKWIITKYGEEIIHHELNMKLVHACDRCNSGVQMSPNKTELVEAHVKIIKEAIANE
jgi:5-methylcytosine-specific restriction endonuclease McrA